MHLTRADLEDVPIALLSSLYRAANEADEDTILTLLRQIPQQADGVDGFSSLVADFRYDDIMALTKDQA